jgi:hypothetical protein
MPDHIQRDGIADDHILYFQRKRILLFYAQRTIPLTKPGYIAVLDLRGVSMIPGGLRLRGN